MRKRDFDRVLGQAVKQTGLIVRRGPFHYRWSLFAVAGGYVFDDVEVGAVIRSQQHFVTGVFVSVGGLLHSERMAALVPTVYHEAVGRYDGPELAIIDAWGPRLRELGLDSREFKAELADLTDAAPLASAIASAAVEFLDRLTVVCRQSTPKHILRDVAHLDPVARPGTRALYELAQGRTADAARICAEHFTKPRHWSEEDSVARVVGAMSETAPT
jgi:hypothetical protein